MKIGKLASYVVYRYSDIEGGITPLKLQKMLFYAKAWGLVSGEYLVDASFQKWKNGPVNPHIYHSYKHYGANQIIAEEFEPIIPKSKKDALDFVLDSYVPYSAIALSSMTHSEAPWVLTDPNQAIDDQLIFDYYSEQSFAKNFPLGYNSRYYPANSDVFASFTFDMDKSDSASEISFDSIDEFMSIMLEAKNSFNEVKEKLENLKRRI